MGKIREKFNEVRWMGFRKVYLVEGGVKKKRKTPKSGRKWRKIGKKWRKVEGKCRE